MGIRVEEGIWLNREGCVLQEVAMRLYFPSVASKSLCVATKDRQ